MSEKRKHYLDLKPGLYRATWKGCDDSSGKHVHVFQVVGFGLVVVPDSDVEPRIVQTGAGCSLSLELMKCSKDGRSVRVWEVPA